MHVNLGFSHGPDAFQVTVLRHKERQGFDNPVILQYPDEGRLLALIFEAEVDPVVAARIVEAVGASAIAPGADACCIEVTLSDQQFHTLVFGATQNEADQQL